MERNGWDEEMLTREDIGYGPARPYEAAPGQPLPRERRRAVQREAAPRERPGEGPYRDRLRRRRRPDHWIRADIEQALFLDTWLDADRIHVQVRNGTAYLTGMLRDPAEVQRAARHAEAAAGVVTVRNRLEVEA